MATDGSNAGAPRRWTARRVFILRVVLTLVFLEIAARCLIGAVGHSSNATSGDQKLAVLAGAGAALAVLAVAGTSEWRRRRGWTGSSQWATWFGCALLTGTGLLLIRTSRDGRLFVFAAMCGLMTAYTVSLLLGYRKVSCAQDASRLNARRAAGRTRRP